MSDLRTRLHALSGSTPSPLAGAGRGDGPPSLAERIARLRVRAARIDAAAPTEGDIAKLVGGMVVAPMLILVERRYPLPFQHGAIHLACARELADGVRLSLPLVARPDPESLVMLDTETSGLAGGTGTLAFLVGLARVRRESLVVMQFLVTGFGGEAAMLERVHAAVAGAGCLVSYNGKSFDVPLLKTRARLAGLVYPYEDRPHLDLLHTTRRRLREGWPDCRLRTAEEQALGFARTNDLPGSEVPAAWQRWLQRRDPTALPRILAHNREDLLSLAGLLTVLAEPTPREAPLLHQRAA